MFEELDWKAVAIGSFVILSGGILAGKSLDAGSVALFFLGIFIVLNGLALLAFCSKE